MEPQSDNSSTKSHVEFTEEGGGHWPAVKYYEENRSPKAIELAIKYSGGLIKNEEQALKFLLYFSVAALILAFFLVFKDKFNIVTSGDRPPVLYREDVSPELLKTLPPEEIMKLPSRLK